MFQVVALSPTSAKVTWDADSDVESSNGTYVLRDHGTSIATLPAGTLTYTAIFPVEYAYSIEIDGVSGQVTGKLPAPTSTGKADLIGFLDRDTVNPSLSVLVGGVCNVRWDELQTAPFSALMSNNPIDQAITTLQKANGSTGKRGIRVRLFLGSNSPGHQGKLSWPQSIGGTPITVTGGQGQSGQVGHYWTAQFSAAYNDLQIKLSAKYDSVPEIRSVTLAMAMLLYAEPYLKYDSVALIAAGDSSAADIASYTSMMEAHLVWKSTCQTLSFNPALFPGEGGVTFTLAQMALFRSKFAKQGVLMNNSIRASSLGNDYTTMYDSMKSAGGPISFQTATLSKMGDAATTFGLCVGYGAQSIELPSGYAGLSATLLESWTTKLVASGS